MSRHKLRTTIPYGDPDVGAEVDVEITFEYRSGALAQGSSYTSGGQPTDPDEIEFINAVQHLGGKPVAAENARQQGWLDDKCRDWLETDRGFEEVEEVVFNDDEIAREAAAEMRRDDNDA